ncbi:MAG: SUF system Fe-S cluster assembly regulator [Gammaproteobacteria bacterium]
MLRIRKLTDYGTVLLAAMASRSEPWLTASELAESTQLSYATVGKLLKLLVHAHLLQSQRGSHGGYRLARSPQSITALEILEALEGEIAVTECGLGTHRCNRESFCAVSPPWRRINWMLKETLSHLSLADLIPDPTSSSPLPYQARNENGSNHAIGLDTRT